MKKLIPMMAVAAVAFGAFAKTPIKSQGFEGATAGAVADLDALTKGDADLVWKTDDTGATLTVSAYDAEKETPYTYGTQDKYFGDTNTQKLEIDSSKPVYAGYGASTGILADGTYIDTLVKFTVTDQDTAVETDTNAKLAIWAQATNAEGTENVLKIANGVIDGETLVTETNELSKTNVSADQWYRLTVRTAMTDKTIKGKAIAAFTVYLDGVKLTAGEQDTFLACVTGDQIEGVGFKGNGAVDDVAITDNENAPSFAAITASTMVTCGDGIVSFKVGETTYTAAASVKIPAAITAEDITDIVTINGVAATVSVDEGTIAITANAALEGGYLTIAEALEKGATTLNLVADLTETLEDSLIVSTAVTIDLAGNNVTFKGTGLDAALVAADKGTITIVDSQGAGVMSAESPITYADKGGAIVIGSTADTDKGATFVGLLAASGYDTTINKGKFDKTSNAEADWLENATVATGYELKEVEGYLVVTAKSGPEPEPTYTVTVNAADNTTVAQIASNDVVVATIATAKEGDVIKVTFAPDEDYEFAAEETGVRSVTVEKAAVTITGPEATAIEYVTVAAPVTIDNGSYTVDPNGEKVRKGTEVTVTVTPAAEVDVESITINDEAITAVAGVYAKTFTANEDLEFTVVITKVTPPTPTRPTDIEGGSSEQKAAYDAWAEGKDLTGKTDAQIIDAFILNADVTATAAELETKLGAEITSEMVAALAAGETADFTALKAKYPNATFEFVEYKEIETSAKLYKLTAKFVPENK